QRRGREVVGRESREIARLADPGEHLVEPGTSFCPALFASPLVESRVDGPCRALAPASRKDEHSRIVLREPEGCQLGAGALAELRARREEEGNVRAEAGGELVQLGRGQRLVEGLVGEAQRGGSVRAPAAQPDRDRDLLADRCLPTRSKARGRGKRLERGSDECVLWEALDAELE